MKAQKNLRWYNLAIMAFAMIWGFANMVNNFALQGLGVIFSWVMVLALYFAPYALMVGELGSAFKEEKGGVASWIGRTSGKRWAFFAGWTYWVVHIPYLAQRPQAMLIAWGWITRQDTSLVEGLSPLVTQLICLGLFFVFLWIASQGIKILKPLGTIAGAASLIMSLLFMVLMFAAPLFTHVQLDFSGWSWRTFIPKFDFQYLTTLSMVLFAVGGAEKISPYIKYTKNPAKEFPKGMIALVILVAVNALVGSLAMGLMYSGDIPEDLLTNGQYYAFVQLGEYYGAGNWLMMIYGVANLAVQATALAFAIDAPLRMLLADADKDFVPDFLRKQNRKGIYVRGYLMTAVLTSILIVIPAFGMGDMDGMFAWLLNLNTVVMPIRYIWVFLAYILLKRQQDKFPSDYRFFRSRKWGCVVGGWCLAITVIACALGMVPKGVESGWGLQLSLNIGTPIVLLALGGILPWVARRRAQKV